MQPTGVKRKAVALGILGLLAVMAWFTVDPGRVRWLVMVLLGGFALRVLLSSPSSGYDSDGSKEGLM